MSLYRKGGKRALDIALALAGLPVVGATAIIAGPLLRRDGGPALHRSTRLGHGQAPFTMLKFRSMIVDAPDLRNADGSTFNAADDPRVTPVGRVLRRTSLDELPQILNVLRGDMSFVGPRPSPTGNQSRYDEVALRRFEVKPGITGLDQALNRNSGTLEERFANDARYVEDCSLSLDLWILGRTFLGVGRQEGLYRNA